MHSAESEVKAEGVGDGYGWFPLHPAAVQLDLSSRGLQVLPGSLQFMVGLTTLKLDDNALSGLPVWLKHLTSLRQLSLCSNLFSEIPQVLPHV
jgi:Leucine-rich repeat (LRR) protein